MSAEDWNIFDPIKRPMYYDGDGIIKAKDALKSMMKYADGIVGPEAGYWWGLAFKYIWRWPFKHQGREKVRDIEKAIECLTLMKEAVEGDYKHAEEDDNPLS